MNDRERIAEQYKQYRRKQIAELVDWTPDFDMSGVSISEADSANGSPKLGDKIARNPKNHKDRWLVAEKYFADNFEPLGYTRQPELSEEDFIKRATERMAADGYRFVKVSEPSANKVEAVAKIIEQCLDTDLEDEFDTPEDVAREILKLIEPKKEDR